MPVCSKCREHKRAGEFAKNTARGKPIITLCKLCVAERSKLSFREKRWSRFIAELGTWPDIKLLSEVAYLQAKVTAIKAETRKRDVEERAKASA